MSMDINIYCDPSYARTMLKRIKKNLPGYTMDQILQKSGLLLVHNTQLFIKTNIGGYHKPPYDTGAMHDSVRIYGGMKNSGNKKSLQIAVGGVRRMGKDVNYARYVYEGRGPHRGRPRRFTDDAVRFSMPGINNIIAKEIEEMVGRMRFGYSKYEGWRG